MTETYLNGECQHCLEYPTEEMFAVMYKLIIYACNTYIRHPEKSKFLSKMTLISTLKNIGVIRYISLVFP